MTNQTWDDDEDWSGEDWSEDEDDDPDEEDAARCPECHGPVHIVTDKCPSCGYWLSEADRRTMWSGMTRPLWQKVVAAILVLGFLICLLLAGLSLF